MRVVIVNCFDTYEDRIDLIHEFFLNIGHKVTVVQSNFRHFKKVKRTESKQNFMFIDTKPYYKNMSMTRMKSHNNFSKKAFRIVEDLNPDLLYVIVPPNSLAKFASKYKITHSNVKLIFDLIDLWPETMPIGKIKVLPPFNFWRIMRDKSLKYADIVITECDLYQNVLKDILKGIKTETLYLAKTEVSIVRNPVLSREEIHLCYLGSINNIIDIFKIKKIIELIHKEKPVTLHIIGDGESKDILIEEIKSTGAVVLYHGKIYDQQKKQIIFDKCQYGLNIMKDTVCVGLTMKSIDYFQAGLPIINSIQADTTEIIEKYNIGINVTNDNIENVVAEIINNNIEELFYMRKNARDIFEKLFSVGAFNEKLQAIIKEL